MIRNLLGYQRVLLAPAVLTGERLFVGLDHVLDHAAAHAAGLTAGKIAVVALLKVYADLVGDLHLETVHGPLASGTSCLVFLLIFDNPLSFSKSIFKISTALISEYAIIVRRNSSINLAIYAK